jgi:hypothetical protein
MSGSSTPYLQAALKDIPEEAVTLPLPRRLALTDVQNLINQHLGPLVPMMNKHAKLQSQTHKFVDEVYENPDLLDYMNHCGFETMHIAMYYLRQRQTFLKAPILTISPGLKGMLSDTGIKDNVPAKFLSAPFKTCYLEFEPAEQRKALALQATQKKKLEEGCYLQEAQLEKCPDMPRAQREQLGLDPNAPVRLIEISFSYSPLNHPSRQDGDIGVIFDKTDYIAIFIQDENEPVKDVIERHMDFYGSSGFHVANLSQAEKAEFREELHNNCSRLMKALFYLHVDRKTQVVQRDASDLQKRLDGVGASKKSKIAKQLNKAYDRILIGPEKYVPIAERFEVDSTLKGRRAPHYRRGYFGLRWVGTGQAKTTELTRISETIVNEKFLTDTTPRDYDIR